METRLQTPRTRNRRWGFFGTCATNGHVDPEAAWDEADGDVDRPAGPVPPRA